MTCTHVMVVEDGGQVARGKIGIWWLGVELNVLICEMFLNF